MSGLEWEYCTRVGTSRGQQAVSVRKDSAASDQQTLEGLRHCLGFGALSVIIAAAATGAVLTSATPVAAAARLDGSLPGDLQTTFATSPF